DPRPSPTQASDASAAVARPVRPRVVGALVAGSVASTPARLTLPSAPVAVCRHPTPSKVTAHPDPSERSPGEGVGGRLNCSGELIDVYPGWPDAGVAGGVGGDQREATIVGAQHGVRVGLVTAECADSASAGCVEV